MRALVAHPGTQHAFQLATELHRLDGLLALHTGIAVASGSRLDKLIRYLPGNLQRRISNRIVEELPARLLRLQPLKELASVIQVAWGRNEQRVFHWRNEHFQRAIPRHELESADAVIGFDTSSWILARRCLELDKPMLLVQTIGHPDSRVAMENEIAARFPEWSEITEPRLPMVRAAEQQEHEQASVIVASSSFTRQTLTDNGVAAEKIHVLPHGVDCSRFFVAPERIRDRFRFVFAGAIMARKGVPLLLETWRKLQPIDAELWLVGPASAKARSLLPKLSGLRYCGPVAANELPNVFQQCDVFVFPSYFEGFARVILEAMASGLPVITTSATAWPDLFGEKPGGWIIQPGDDAALAHAMRHCVEHASDMRSAGLAARRIAEQFSWQVYGKRWMELLQEIT